MGLLGGTKIVVSSVSWNLAGDYGNTPNYLKSLIIGNIVGTDNPSGIGDLLRSGYINGPGMDFRRFRNWAERTGNYEHIGVPYATCAGFVTPAQATVADFLTDRYAGNPGWNVLPEHLRFLHVSRFDPFWHAVQSVADRNGDGALSGDGWSVDFKPETNQIEVYDYFGIFPPGYYYTDVTPGSADKHYLYMAYVGNTPIVGVGDFYRIFVDYYEIGSGNADMDAAAHDIDVSTDEFFPCIPLRTNGQFLADAIDTSAYNQTKRAYKKVFKQSLPKLIAKLGDHPNIADMDFATIILGVSADTREPEGKEYLYRFFDRMRTLQTITSTDHDAYAADYVAYTASTSAYKDWLDGGEIGSPPALTTVPSSQASSIRITGGVTPVAMQFDMEMRWQLIQEVTGTGLGKLDAVVGEYWFDIHDDEGDAYFASAPVDNTGTKLTSLGLRGGLEEVYLVHQETSTSWRALRLVGATHRNYVYKGNFVETRLYDALIGTDESGFIVPLHRGICREMGIVKATQLGSACAYLVINCYEIVKTGFLSGILSIFFFVAAIVLAVVLPPAGGLLGANLAVGSAIGLTGVIATIAGAVINAIAAMVVMKIIQKVSIAVFGEKLGAIIGAVVGFVAIAVGTGLSNGMDMSAIWSNMTSASSLLQLTSAVGAGIAGYVQGAIHEVMQDMADLNKKSSETQQQINDAYAKNIGYGNGLIDPMSLTDTPFSSAYETPTQFLSRTLLTGSDIADLSLGMLTNMCQLTLSTNLPNSG